MKDLNNSKESKESKESKKNEIIYNQIKWLTGC